jgi:hypothetical protein
MIDDSASRTKLVSIATHYIPTHCPGNGRVEELSSIIIIYKSIIYSSMNCRHIHLPDSF